MKREERKKAAKVIRHMLSSTDLTDRANMTKDMVEACEMAINDMKIIEKLKRMTDMYSQQGHAPTRTISMEDLREMIE